MIRDLCARVRQTSIPRETCLAPPRAVLSTRRATGPQFGARRAVAGDFSGFLHPPGAAGVHKITCRAPDEREPPRVTGKTQNWLPVPKWNSRRKAGCGLGQCDCRSHAARNDCLSRLPQWQDITRRPKSWSVAAGTRMWLRPRCVARKLASSCAPMGCQIVHPVIRDGTPWRP